MTKRDGARPQRRLHTTDVAMLVAAVALMLLLAWSVTAGSIVGAIAAGVLLSADIVMGGSMNAEPDDMRSQATERTLRVATTALEHLRGGLTKENAEAICALLLPETAASALAITDTVRVLAFEGGVKTAYPAGALNAEPTIEVLESKHMETFVSMDENYGDVRHFFPSRRSDGSCYGIIVPLLVQDRAVGTIKFYFRRDVDIDKTQLAIAEGLGTLLSTQLSSYELDRQAELTARAEVKALQAQINPHFLFNTLNTIASFTRTDPNKARDLLREFSMFYRRTLESSEKTLISLSEELEQTRRYLNIEKARFGEDRIVEAEYIEAGCDVLTVPAFLVQPIAENAVRHAMRDEGPLHVDIHVARDGGDILIAVADDGLGMDEAAARKLSESAMEPTPGDGERGAGMALRNVAERVERFYGVGSGVEIVSKLGEGTCVTLRLADAVMMLAEPGQLKDNQTSVLANNQ